MPLVELHAFGEFQSSAVVEDSSTVMTPSCPPCRRPRRSARRSPGPAPRRSHVGDLGLALDSRATSSSRSLTASTAASMPRLGGTERPRGPRAQALLDQGWRARWRSWCRHRRRSLVLGRDSLASWAPRFSYGSSSSTSLAMVTPSLVMGGAPHFLSMTTFGLGAQRHLDGIGERVDAALERAACGVVELQGLGHAVLPSASWLCCRRNSRQRRPPDRPAKPAGRGGVACDAGRRSRRPVDHFSMTARTSRPRE